jgi:predicted nucleic acid-binding protein
VANGLILGTTFLVDLDRELKRGEFGPAQRFLKERSAEPLFLTFTVAGELAAGPGLTERSHWEELIGPFQVLQATPDVCWEYGRAFRYLATNGLLIGTNDLWIAATALAFGKAVVTRNSREFERVPGLEVRRY